MSKYLILVKHSQPVIDKELPAREWKLSEEGRQRTGRLTEKLKPYLPDVLISSMEPKAVETAELLANKLNLRPHVFDHLHEHDRSGAPYFSNEDFQHAVREFFTNPDSRVYGNETADEAHERFSRAVYSILKKYSEQTVVIVAHGTVIALFVSRLTGQPGYKIWKELGLPSFVVIDVQSNSLVTLENIH